MNVSTAGQVSPLSENEQLMLDRWALWLRSAEAFDRVHHEVLDDHDRSRLSDAAGGAKAKYGDAAEMWGRARGASGLAAQLSLMRILRPDHAVRVERIAKKLQLTLHETELDLQRAVKRHTLVVVIEPFAIYWRGELVRCNLSRNSQLRDYLKRLAQKSLRGHWLQRREFGEYATDILSSRKTRLKGMKGFPSDLLEHIEINRGSGAHRLALDKSQIMIIESSD